MTLNLPREGDARAGFVHRAIGPIAGIWAGVMLGLGAVAAPSAFSILPRADAGRLVGQMLTHEAHASLVVVAVLLIALRWGARDGGSIRPGGSFWLVLGALFCTVAGYFAVLPMMEAARAGQGRLSFAALHAVSGAFFVLKGLLLAAVAWKAAAAAGSPVRRLVTTS